MAEETATTDNTPFDITKIRQLVKLMKDNDVSEIYLQWEDSRVRLRRGGDQVITTMPAQMAYAPVPAGAPAPQAAAPEAKPAEPAKKGLTIPSPIVGTLYLTPNPDSPAFVTVGTKVTPDTVVCIVEAMKVFNEIQAGVSGTITKVLSESGAVVEYGQPLFEVEP